MQQVSIALRINTAGQQRDTFYSRSSSLYYLQPVIIAILLTAGHHRYTTQQVSNAIHFTAAQHRYCSAGQQRNTIQATLNHNVAEIEIQGKTRGNFATILQQ